MKKILLCSILGYSLITICSEPQPKTLLNEKTVAPQPKEKNEEKLNETTQSNHFPFTFQYTPVPQTAQPENSYLAQQGAHMRHLQELQALQALLDASGAQPVAYRSDVARRPKDYYNKSDSKIEKKP